VRTLLLILLWKPLMRGSAARSGTCSGKPLSAARPATEIEPRVERIGLQQFKELGIGDLTCGDVVGTIVP
jgi:hypothetical protein